MAALASMPLISTVWLGGAFQRNTALTNPATPGQVAVGRRRQHEHAVGAVAPDHRLPGAQGHRAALAGREAPGQHAEGHRDLGRRALLAEQLREGGRADAEDDALAALGPQVLAAVEHAGDAAGEVVDVQAGVAAGQVRAAQVGAADVVARAGCCRREFEPPRFDPPRFLPLRFEPPRFDPARFEPPRLVAARLLPPRLLPPRLVPPRLEPPRFEPVRLCAAEVGPAEVRPRQVGPAEVGARQVPAAEVLALDGLLLLLGGARPPPGAVASSASPGTHPAPSSTPTSSIPCPARPAVAPSPQHRQTDHTGDVCTNCA